MSAAGPCYKVGTEHVVEANIHNTPLLCTSSHSQTKESASVDMKPTRCAAVCSLEQFTTR